MSPAPQRISSVQPLLSVRLMVYNHEPFLRDALDGILMQETDFPFEVVIGDDFSTDGSRAILEEYAERRPDIFRMLDRPVGGEYYKARKASTRILNWTDIVDHCRGKYIALLDGDDYWTDPGKLQLQVDFLEENRDFSIVFHRARRLYIEEDRQEFTNPGQPEITDGLYLLEKGWHMYTPTIVFRKSELPEKWPDWVYNVESMDYAVECMLTADGQKIRYIDSCLCDYRTHSQNNTAKVTADYLSMLNMNRYLLQCIRTFQSRPEAFRLIDRKLSEYDTERFIHIREKKNKSIRDWTTTMRLAFRLGKFHPHFLYRKYLAGTEEST